MRSILLKIKNVLVVLTVLSIASACSDYLEQPVVGAADENEFYRTDGEAMGALIAVYDAYSSSYIARWASVYMLKELPSDDVNAGGSGPGDEPELQAIDDFKPDPSATRISEAWTNLWATIYRANKVINKITPDTEVKKQVVADAKFLRSLVYFDLLILWGGVPIITDEIPEDQLTKQVRASKKEVLAFIQKDLTEAIPDLPLKSALSTGKYRPAKGAAQALLGKAYLYDEKWAQARTQLETVITSNEYKLFSDPMAAFHVPNKFKDESLFELNYGGNNQGVFPWGDLVADDNTIIQLMGPRGDAGLYQMAPTDSLLGGWGFETPRQELYDAYVAAGDVGRRKRFMMSSAELTAAGGSWVNASHDYEGMIRRKYGSFKNHNTTGFDFNYASNFVLLRYADVLLMAAEASYRDNDPDDAKIYLNQVRKRAVTNLPDVTATGDALFEAIVLERRLELAFEGHRFADLVRWNKAAAELGNLGFVAGKHEVLPLPAIEVNITGLPQNPGY
jgi:hypothetical protein